ncbi:zonadhesin-like [Rhinatrema bivittatum]|uniref:zonadhesin-like n=1 Tax=Rhinatrema bivittatum TaxID=194408 RepID=UPI00112CC235|nr:zonadhesin-like [Rhinatrema bivittatum]
MMQIRSSLFLLMALPALLLEVQMTAALAIKQCGLHQTYNECGSACPTNCYNLFDKARTCTRQCASGCFCDPGYVLKDDISGECVLASECQGLCPENSEYKTCGSPCEQINCDDDLNVESPRICPAMCVSGCFCKPGHVYQNGRSGACVHPFDCPPRVNHRNQ